MYLKEKIVLLPLIQLANYDFVFAFSTLCVLGSSCSRVLHLGLMVVPGCEGR
jgi:hypothetical protein